MDAFIRDAISQSISVKQLVLADGELIRLMEAAARATIRSLQNRGKVLLCGNGGSAADAQHLAGEFVSRFRFDRPALPAVALNTNASILTSIGNDYEYSILFSRQIEALSAPGDVLWAFSTTGNSENIKKALSCAKERGVLTVAFLGGKGGGCLQYADFPLLVPCADTPRVQEAHIMMGHILCDCIEKTMFKPQ